MPVFELALDVHKRAGAAPKQVVVRAGDVGTQVIRAALSDDGEAYAPSGATARLDVMHADGTWARCAASVSGSTATCTLPAEAACSPGMCRLAHFVLEYADGRAESTEGFGLMVLPSVDGSGAGAAYYDDKVEALYERWLAYEQEAEAQEQARERASATAADAASSAAQEALDAALAAKSASGSDSAVWLGYDDDGYLCVYEVES